MKQDTQKTEVLTPSQRTYTDVETGQNCRMYTSGEYESKTHHLFYENNGNETLDGPEVKGYYIADHTGATIKLNTGKKVFVDMGQFYKYKPGEHATHRKFLCMGGFKNI